MHVASNNLLSHKKEISGGKKKEISGEKKKEISGEKKTEVATRFQN